AEAVVRTMPQAPPIEHGATGAWYEPIQDVVRMPEPGHFSPLEAYYSTLYHELVHSTGHKSRLGRDIGDRVPRFGSTDYSQEELVAEMGAAFLCGHCGIEQATVENSAAYIQGWLKKLKGDHKLVVIAAAQAQKAADFIRGIRPAQ
ncbi:MAG: zincin-like metallopeptidase domain-containing protein, partial [Acidobacteriota bacterium]